MDVPGANNKILDYYVDMNLIETTIGVGAIKQLKTSEANAEQVIN